MLAIPLGRLVNGVHGNCNVVDHVVLVLVRMLKLLSGVASTSGINTDSLGPSWFLVGFEFEKINEEFYLRCSCFPFDNKYYFRYN